MLRIVTTAMTLAAVPVLPPAARASEIAALPRVVQPVFEALAKRCRAVGGALAWSPQAVPVVHLNATGTPDFVVDTRHVACSAPEQPWQAPHGREVHVFIAVGPGSWVEAWKGYALEWAVVPQDGRPVLEIETRGVCRDAGPRCRISYALRENRLVEVARQRAD